MKKKRPLSESHLKDAFLLVSRADVSSPYAADQRLLLFCVVQLQQPDSRS